MKPKTIVFCLPGREFSNNFLRSWSEVLLWCVQNNIRPLLSNHYSPLLYYVRNMCLGGDTLRGKDQKPFDGKLDYDYLMWIDSDIVFNPEQLKKLIGADKDIVSGLYMMSDNKHFATVENMDDEFFKKNGHYQFLTREDLEKKEELFEVDYTGFGFVLIKKGVFEKFEYPWFRPVWTNLEVDGKQVQDFSMEDVAFCKIAKEKGYKILIDPKIIVGHEKSFII
jgi:hypothetical protein